MTTTTEFGRGQAVADTTTQFGGNFDSTTQFGVQASTTTAFPFPVLHHGEAAPGAPNTAAGGEATGQEPSLPAGVVLPPGVNMPPAGVVLPASTTTGFPFQIVDGKAVFPGQGAPSQEQQQ